MHLDIAVSTLDMQASGSTFNTDEPLSLASPTGPSVTPEDSMLDLISSAGIPYTVTVPDPYASAGGSPSSSMSAFSSSMQISFEELNDL